MCAHLNGVCGRSRGRRRQGFAPKFACDQPGPRPAHWRCTVKCRSRSWTPSSQDCNRCLNIPSHRQLRTPLYLMYSIASFHRAFNCFWTVHVPSIPLFLEPPWESHLHLALDLQSEVLQLLLAPNKTMCRSMALRAAAISNMLGRGF